MVHVVKIVLSAACDAAGIGVGVARYLSEARHAGKHGEASLVVRNDLLPPQHVLLRLGPRPDQRHLASYHVQQEWQVAQRAPLDPASQRAGGWIEPRALQPMTEQVLGPPLDAAA